MRTKSRARERASAEQRMVVQIRACRMERERSEANVSVAVMELSSDIKSVAAMVDSKQQEHMDAAARVESAPALAAWLRIEEDCTSKQRRIDAALHELQRVV